MEQQQEIIIASKWENGIVQFACPFCRHGVKNKGKSIIHQHGASDETKCISRGKHCSLEIQRKFFPNQDWYFKIYNPKYEPICPPLNYDTE